jgi:hypothetical protein
MATKAKSKGTAAAKKLTAKKNGEASLLDPPDEKARAIAKMALRPSVNAAVVMESYSKPFGDVDIEALVDSLSAGINDVWAGDLKRAEAMLFGQANALQTIFMNLARRAASQEYLKQWEAYLRMAMKAQNQCRMTLETLATIKNPPMLIARQANINNGGQQQVNNIGPAHPAHAPAPATNEPIEQTELLEASDGEWLDTRAPSSAGGADPQLETVAAVDRPTQRGR